MKLLRLALRMAVREWRTGELRVLWFAVLIAVAGLGSIDGFTARMHAALRQESHRLLGADLVLVSDHAPDRALLVQARSYGLRSAEIEQFPSMVSHAGKTSLAQVKAVGTGYPLRGQLRIADVLLEQDRPAAGIPLAGTVWIEPRLAQALQVHAGSELELGYSKLKVAALLTNDPDLGGEMFNLAPWLIMNRSDIPATKLIGPGSRVSYRLLFAGTPDAVRAFQSVLAQKLERGQKLLTVADARPQIREMLDKAEKYLGLAVLLSVVLAAVAISLSARHFVRRHLDACALLRCFGARQQTIVWIFMLQITGTGLLATVLGMALGYAGQSILSGLVDNLTDLALPPVTLLPFLQAGLGGMILLTGFSFPALTALRNVPTVRILRRESVAFNGRGGLMYLAGFISLVLLMFWQVHDARLTLWITAGLTGFMLLTALMAWVLIHAAGRLGEYYRTGWGQGLLNLRRRSGSSIILISAFTLAMLSLLLLSIVRGELLDDWHDTLPVNAPNRFVINIQPQQLPGLGVFFRQRGMNVSFFPMIRGRLTAINGREVNSGDYADSQTRHLLNREFNLSYADSLARDTVFAAGKGWTGANPPGQFSLEQGIADRLHVKVGDSLSFEVGGMPVSAPVSSIRKVKWDSFKVNFFVVANSALLKNMPASYVTSFYLPQARIAVLNELIKAYPDLTVIDVSAILHTIESELKQAAQAIEFVFLFSLASALAVLYATLVASRDERARETAVWRVLGASRRQLLVVQSVEFAAAGLSAGLLAATGASITGWIAASRLFGIPYHADMDLWVISMFGGCIGITVVGILSLRPLNRLKPTAILRAAIE
ncbi:MAG TPA: FtsX-like permease family protein [Burkholderiales bacterium]|nr:FtsX-like permease family protein [Burkholderiales bacterium]